MPPLLVELPLPPNETRPPELPPLPPPPPIDWARMPFDSWPWVTIASELVTPTVTTLAGPPLPPRLPLPPEANRPKFEPPSPPPPPMVWARMPCELFPQVVIAALLVTWTMPPLPPLPPPPPEALMITRTPAAATTATNRPGRPMPWSRRSATPVVPLAVKTLALPAPAVSRRRCLKTRPPPSPPLPPWPTWLIATVPTE